MAQTNTALNALPPQGLRSVPQAHDPIMFCKGSEHGLMLQEGINEAAARLR